MAGTLVLTTLSDGTNSTSATNCIRGSARAWVNFYGVGTATVNASYNVSSVTRNGTGDYTVNFTSAMTDANYVVTLCGTSNGGDAARGTYGIYAAGGITTAPTTMTTSAVRFIGGGKYAETSVSDFYTMTCAILGN